MKYFSVLILLALMAWTWSLATSPQDFGLEQHKEIESNFERIVRQQIQAKNPTAKNIYFDQLYTEVIKPSAEINVHFRYMMEIPVGGTDTAEQISEGVTTLRWDEKQQAWNAVKTDAGSPEMRFREGSRISTKEKPDDEPPAESVAKPTVESTPTPTPEANRQGP